MLDPSVFILVGSRSVLPPDKVRKSDFDFIAPDTPEAREYLVREGFVEKTIDEGYMDIASTAVFIKNSFGVDGNALTLPIQVVLKKPELWKYVLEFWGDMWNKPELFMTKYWKSYGDCENICELQDDIRFLINEHYKTSIERDKMTRSLLDFI